MLAPTADRALRPHRGLACLGLPLQSNHFPFLAARVRVRAGGSAVSLGAATGRTVIRAPKGWRPGTRHTLAAQCPCRTPPRLTRNAARMPLLDTTREQDPRASRLSQAKSEAEVSCPACLGADTFLSRLMSCYCPALPPPPTPA